MRSLNLVECVKLEILEMVGLYVQCNTSTPINVLWFIDYVYLFFTF